MSRVKETFHVSVEGDIVTIEHDGKKKLENQEENIHGPLEYIARRIREGNESGFIPYDNFECSIAWKKAESAHPPCSVRMVVSSHLSDCQIDHDPDHLNFSKYLIAKYGDVTLEIEPQLEYEEFKRTMKKIGGEDES